MITILLVIFIVLLLTFLSFAFYIVYQYGNSYTMEGIKIPGYVKSDHQRLDPRSHECQEYIKGEIRTLAAFDRFSRSKGIHYTLIAGSLIGCLALGKCIPWDDDIDLLVRESDFPKVRELWNSGTNERKVKKTFDKRWIARDVKLDEQSYVLLANKNNDGWFKLLKTLRTDLPDIGGVDIGYAWMKDGKVYESMYKLKEAPGTTSEYSSEQLRYYRFGDICVMSVTPELGKAYLDKVYNKTWMRTKKEHPDYWKSPAEIIFSRRFVELLLGIKWDK